MITIKSKSEIEKMRIAGKITGDALKLIEKHIRPGVTTSELDKIAFDFIKSKVQHHHSLTTTVFRAVFVLPLTAR